MAVFTFIRVILLICSIIGISMVIPLVTALALGEMAAVSSFGIPMVVAVALGVSAYFAGRKTKLNLSTRNVFALVAISWITISIFGSVPLILSGTTKSIIDAIFESVSGFSTTGATVLSGIDELPRSINLWRCQMHWLGGMGVIALTVALLPLLGVGGFALIKAESSGPEKGKITPKIASTAETLWLLYIGLTAAQMIALLFCGMDFIDALSYAFATLGTGGFATHDASVAYYNSAAVEIVCTVFMFLAGVNFSMYFYVLSGKFSEVKKNSELKAYLSMFFIIVVCITLCLIPHYHSFIKALRYASFQTASIITTTGFASADFLTWPAPAQFFILLLFFTGACSSSTSGGFKIVRWVILGKQAKNEMMRMIHPHGVFSVRLNGKAGRKDLVFNVAAFAFVYAIVVITTTLVGTLCKLDIFTAFTASLSMVGNVGPAFGTLGPSANYGGLEPVLKLWYCFAMIAGRLELYNLIIFFLPEYWEK